MRCFFLVGIALLFAGCNQADRPAAPPAETTTAAPGLPSLDAFADSMRGLTKFEPRSIPLAARYFNQLVPADSLLADSAAVVLLNLVNRVVDSVNNQLANDTTGPERLVYPEFGTPTPAQLAFKRRLTGGHILLESDGEGGIMAVPDYGWVRKTIGPQTSKAVNDYFALLQREAINPTAMDAAIAIEMRELVDRAIASEQLQRRLLPATFASGLADYLRFYTNAVLFGTDNTPALEDDALNPVLTPDFRQGYDYALGTYPASDLSKQIRRWTAAVSAKDTAAIRKMRQAAWQ